MRRVVWMAMGALVMTAVLAAPVLGGPSLSDQLRSLLVREKKLDKRLDAVTKRPLPRGARGPAGPAGATGPKGDTGASGATGAPARLSAVSGFTVTGSIGTSPATIVTAAVPPGGQFLVEGNVVVENGAASATTVTCDLVYGAGPELLDTARVRLGASGGLDTETLAVGAVLQAGAGGSARIECDAGASGVTFTSADLVALG
jgi:hypothetical protein